MPLLNHKEQLIVLKLSRNYLKFKSIWGSFGNQTGVLWVFVSMKILHALQMTSPNNLSKWALQCLFTFWNITILDCNSSHLVLYSICTFFDTNVYNDYWLTSYYQWLEPGNGSSGPTTVCPPVAESPPRKFGPLFFGRHSGPNWSDFWQHLLLQQYNILQRKSSLIYCY